MYWSIVVGEAIGPAEHQELMIVISEFLPMLLAESGFQCGRLLQEDEGLTVVVLTTWDSREDWLRYYLSPSYRQVVAKTQHLLIGQFVIKLFLDA